MVMVLQDLDLFQGKVMTSMCSGTKADLWTACPLMEDGVPRNCSNLLELSASDDLAAFAREVGENGCDLDEPAFWYGRGIGSKKMGFEERTPLMIAAMYGSARILKYVIDSGRVDVNRACGSDGATALHCAAAGGSDSSPEIVQLLLAASADANCVNVLGNKPGHVIAPALNSRGSSRRKSLEMLLNGISVPVVEEKPVKAAQEWREGGDKKEYPVDISLPDINNGVYGTDEFRMYSFKVKPCTRAYSHDWTECPFVHPGENARRRDPRKYPYSCVPCPEFRKGTCRQGDNCEYAHGVFECWLHPAQYRTRLCKDETGCTRKVCFFAHKSEELRPLYASTGSGIPSPRSPSASTMDMGAMSPMPQGSSSLLLPSSFSKPMSPSSAASSPKSISMWNKANFTTPPSLQLQGSRLKTALSARDFDLDMELLDLESCHRQQQQQHLIDEITNLSSQSRWTSKEYSRIGEVKATNLDDVFGNMDTSMLSQLQGLPRKGTGSSQLQSPTGLQMRQNMNQLRSSSPGNFSSLMRQNSSYGLSKSAAFAKRSQSFVDRGAVVAQPLGFTAASNSASMTPSDLSDWSSPSGKLDWGIQGEELNKLKKSASFGFRGGSNVASAPLPSTVEEPDISWVNTLVKDVPTVGDGHFNPGVHDTIPPWVEQLYIEHEQMVA